MDIISTNTCIQMYSENCIHFYIVKNNCRLDIVLSIYVHFASLHKNIFCIMIWPFTHKVNYAYKHMYSFVYILMQK